MNVARACTKRHTGESVTAFRLECTSECVGPPLRAAPAFELDVRYTFISKRKTGDPSRPG